MMKYVSVSFKKKIGLVSLMVLASQMFLLETKAMDEETTQKTSSKRKYDKDLQTEHTGRSPKKRKFNTDQDISQLIELANKNYCKRQMERYKKEIETLENIKIQIQDAIRATVGDVDQK